MNNAASKQFDNAVETLASRFNVSFKQVCDALVAAKS